MTGLSASFVRALTLDPNSAQQRDGATDERGGFFGVKKHYFEIEILIGLVQAPGSISLYLCNVMSASVML